VLAPLDILFFGSTQMQQKRAHIINHLDGENRKERWELRCKRLLARGPSIHIRGLLEKKRQWLAPFHRRVRAHPATPHCS
jgi:hypothetical protein